MSGSNIKDNKVVLKEDVLVFATGTKIITGVTDAQVGETIRDMTVNPGDIIITSEGNFNVMDENGDISVPGSGGSSAFIKTKYSFSYDDFTGEAGTSVSLPLFNLPAKAILTEAVIHETEQFANPALGSIIVSVGVEAQAADVTLDVSSDPASGTTFSRNAQSSLHSITDPTPIVITVDADVEQVSTITQGTVDVYIEYKLLAD